MSPELITPIDKVLREIHAQFSLLHEGEVATYIPELARADPNWFGICLVTPGGNVYEVGDSGQPFTIQSISKPFVYGLALEDRGLAEVSAKVGVEPTGDAFNSISLEPRTGRPRNPMINAGAIATTGLVAGSHPAQRRDRIVAMLSRYAGRPLQVDPIVHRSENETGHRNRAIGHMLRNFDILTEDPTPTVDNYFQQCAVSVTCRDLGVIAATLANHGVNPLTGECALQGAYVEHVLSIMSTCGMYNWAGEWLYRIGIPAKSGVAGGLLAVLPGQLGIGVFSPRLDVQGNSVRGIKVCEALSRYFDLHLFNLRKPAPALRNRYTAAQRGSQRVRPPLERIQLQHHGAEIGVFQLQGSLAFSTTEPVVHAAISAHEYNYLLLDFRRVQSLSESAAQLLYDLLVAYVNRRATLVFCNTKAHRTLHRVLNARLGPKRSDWINNFEHYDTALEWCEDRVIAHYTTGTTTPSFVKAEGNELLKNLSPAQCEQLAAAMVTKEFAAGAVIITAGERSRSLFLIETGRTSVYVDLAAGGRTRIASFCPGMVFGELALIDDSPRSATVIADTPVMCAELELSRFEALGAQDPTIKIQVLKNIALGLCDKLRKANHALSALE
jgi:glutaminase